MFEYLVAFQRFQLTASGYGTIVIVNSVEVKRLCYFFALKPGPSRFSDYPNAETFLVWKIVLYYRCKEMGSESPKPIVT